MDKFVVNLLVFAESIVKIVFFDCEYKSVEHVLWECLEYF